jgi:predicted nucleic acid-binding protein
VGLILDSSVLIPAERKGQNAHGAVADLTSRFPGEDLALSAITVVELAHGIARSNTQERQRMRRQFLNELIAAVPVYAVTPAIALNAGRIDGECTGRGVRIALADLLIGATALELGYRVATINVRHFQMIPHLAIVQF